MTLITRPGSDHTAYDRTGHRKGHGAETIILIHGLGLCRAIWQPFITDLQQHYQVIAYDLYGHGESGPAPETPSLPVFARQIDMLMEACGIDNAHIIGFSIGGMINRRLAMDFPHRCRSLTILNSPHDRGREAQALVEARALRVSDEGKMATLPDALERWFTPAFREAQPEMLEQVRLWRQITDDDSYAGAAWVLANGVEELIRPDPPLTLPTCVATTANDSGSTPAMATQIAAEISGARLHVLAGLQHLGLIEQPQLFINIINEFLDEVHRKDKL